MRMPPGPRRDRWLAFLRASEQAWRVCDLEVAHHFALAIESVEESGLMPELRGYLPVVELGAHLPGGSGA